MEIQYALAILYSPKAIKLIPCIVRKSLYS